MAKALVAERVRRDVEVIARAGLDMDTFVEEALTSLNRALPFDAVCLGTVDPSTRLLTSARKFGDLLGQDDHDFEWGLVEYGRDDPTAFTAMADQGIAATGTFAVTGGDLQASPRMDSFMLPFFGFVDEARLLCRDERNQVWGGIALFRSRPHTPFDGDEIDYLGSLARSFAHGMRSGLLASLAAAPPADPVSGPVVLILGSDDQIIQRSIGAEARLAELSQGPWAGAAEAMIGSIVASARRYARGETNTPPRSRIRTASGRWLVLHATPLSSAVGVSGDVVVTIEEARPPDILPLVVAAFDLTPRERDITQLILQGLDTKEIAQTVYLSTYTVQDHLKSVFDKAGVRSRRELIARVYFDHYAPRIGTEIGPSGWFAHPEGGNG